MLQLTYIVFSMLLALIMQPALAAVDGGWDLRFKPRPKLTVSAFGQPVPGGKVKLPALPATDSITFSPDAATPGTGRFTSAYFSGTWQEKNNRLKGTPTQTVVESLMNEYLQQGSLYGFTFSDGQLIRSKSRMTAKELNNGTLKGTFLHVSHWKIHVTKPRKMTVPLQVKLLAKFKGTRAAVE